MAHMDGDVLRDDWYAEDILQQAEQDGVLITAGEAAIILQLLVENFDCNVGINWDVISITTAEFLSAKGAPSKGNKTVSDVHCTGHVDYNPQPKGNS